MINFEDFKKGIKLFDPDTSELGQKAIKRIVEAKAMVSRRFPFWGGLLNILNTQVTMDIPSFIASYRNFYFNSEYVMEAESKQLNNDLLHGIIHLVSRHISRQGSRDDLAWITSAETSTALTMNDAIYEYLNSRENSFLFNPLEFEDIDISMINNFANMTTEAIYEEIKDDVKEIQEMLSSIGGDGDGEKRPCNCSMEELKEAIKDKYPSGMEEMEEERIQNKVEEQIEKDKQGKTSADIAHLVQLKIEEQKIPWYHYLEKYVQKVIASDYTWMKPNKGMLANGIIMPGLLKEDFEAVIAVDTSGSVSNDEFNEFLSEVGYILKQLPNPTITLIDCDARVNNVRKIDPMEIMNQDIASHRRHGYGGTSFTPVFNWVDNAIKQGEIQVPQILIYFTDGYGSYPREIPDYPTIWVLNNNGYNADNIPFGEVLRFNDK